MIHQKIMICHDLIESAVNDVLNGVSAAQSVHEILLLESIADKRIELVADLSKLAVKNPQETANLIIDSDPTTRAGQTEYVDQILSWIKSGTVIYPEDYETVRSTLRAYFKFKDKLPSLRDTKITDFWHPGNIAALIKASQQKSKAQGRIESFTKIGSDGIYDLYRIDAKDEGIFCKMTQSTGWCVKDPKWFWKYRPPFFMILKSGEPYSLIHVESSQFKDVNDMTMTEEYIAPIRNLVRKNIKIDGDFGELVALLSKEEVVASNSAQTCFNYARIVVKGRFPEGEAIIAGQGNVFASAMWPFWYAKDVIKGPFPAGEDAIARSSVTSYNYAVEVIDGRFPKGEDAIATNAERAADYARLIVQGRFPKGEEVISKEATPAYEYARYVIKGPWAPGEEAISMNGEASLLYAKHVIKGRWPKGEAAMFMDDVIAMHYSTHILKRRLTHDEFETLYQNQAKLKKALKDESLEQSDEE